MRKVLGVILGLIGMAILLLADGSVNTAKLSYSSLVLISTLGYSWNANIFNRYLKEIGPVNIAAMAFGLLLIPSILILLSTEFTHLPLTEKSVLKAIGASVLLGIAGTAIATILFYKLLKRAGFVFSSLVTYGIPFIALLWGLVTGEH